MIHCLENKLLSHVRVILGMRSATPIDMVSAMGTMLPWHAVHAQEHERLYLQLREAKYPQSIAARVFRLAQADQHLGVSAAKRNWVRAWERKRVELAALGIPLARSGLAYHLIPVASGKFGRAVAGRRTAGSATTSRWRRCPAMPASRPRTDR